LSPAIGTQRQCEELALARDAELGVGALAVGEHALQADAEVQRDALGGHAGQHAGGDRQLAPAEAALQVRQAGSDVHRCPARRHRRPARGTGGRA
jgi:hypothetical protein